MSAPQRSGQLSSCAAPLLHSSLLLAADALRVPCRSRPELKVQKTAACTKVISQPCHLCRPHSVRCAKHAMLTCGRRPNLRSACCLHGERLGPPPPAIRTAQEPRAPFPQAPERPSAAERELVSITLWRTGVRCQQVPTRSNPCPALCLHAAKRGSLLRTASITQEPHRPCPQASGQSNAPGSSLAAPQQRGGIAVISSQ